MKRLISFVLTAAMALTMVACGTGAPGSAAGGGAASTGGGEAAAQGKKVLTVMHNSPDASNTLHQYYLDVKARFEAKYPDTTVEYEIYENETYKKKLQIYGSTKTMPDVFFVWSNPSEFMPYVNAGLAAELDPNDFVDFNFLPGAFEGATVDGKLMGLPLGIDYWYLYVNKKLLADNGLKLPKTIEEFKTVIDGLNKAGIAPITMNGKELWNQAVLFNDILFRYTGGNGAPIADATNQVTKFAETPEFEQAAEAYKALVELGMFQNSWTTDDEATSKNLFIQGKAAMWYTGTWNNSVATDENVPAEVRENLAVIPFPSTAEADTSTSLMGREGTTMMVAQNSALQAEAVNFLKTFFDPEFYPKVSWEQGIGIPMQKFDQFVKDTDPAVLQEVAASISSAKSVASHPFAFRLTPVFEQECKDLVMQYLLGTISVQEFWSAVDTSAAANQVK